MNCTLGRVAWYYSVDNLLFLMPWVGFSLLCLARGQPSGFLNQSKSSIILKRSEIFALSLKQMGSSSFHMFIYARSEQCDLGPDYTITNMQHIRIYPGKLKFKPGQNFTGSRTLTWQTYQRKPNSIHVSYYCEFIRTPLFTQMQIRSVSVFRFVHLCCKFTWINKLTLVI